jgi:hypothetical protein
MTNLPPALRRFRVTIGEIMGLVVLAALACEWPALIPTSLVAVVTWFAAGRGAEPARQERVALGVVLAAVFAPPLASVVLADQLAPLVGAGRGPGWREWWSPFAVIAPGAPLALVIEGVSGLGRFLARRSPRVAIDAAFTLGSLATAAEVTALIHLAGQSRRRRIVAAALGLLGSAVCTYLTTLFAISLGGV